MPEDRRLSVAEVRRTIATSLTAAFGFVIALLWNQVVMASLSAAGVSTQAPKDVLGLLLFVVTAIIVTVVMIVLMIVFGRWGGGKT